MLLSLITKTFLQYGSFNLKLNIYVKIIQSDLWQKCRDCRGYLRCNISNNTESEISPSLCLSITVLNFAAVNHLCQRTSQETEVYQFVQRVQRSHLWAVIGCQSFFPQRGAWKPVWLRHRGFAVHSSRKGKQTLWYPGQ